MQQKKTNLNINKRKSKKYVPRLLPSCTKLKVVNLVPVGFLVVQVDSPIFGPVLRAAPPLRFSETPSVAEPGCATGQHSRSILASLGYDDAAIDDLIDKSVVATEKRPLA